MLGHVGMVYTPMCCRVGMRIAVVFCSITTQNHRHLFSAIEEREQLRLRISCPPKVVKDWAREHQRGPR